MLTKPVSFIAQVGSSYCSVRYKNRVLVILPCPRSCLTMAYDCLLLCKLLLCGDIKTNPSSHAETLKRIFEGRKKIFNSIAELNVQIIASNTGIATLTSQVTKIDKSLQSMRSNNSNNAVLDDTLKLLRSPVTRNCEKLLGLEDTSRRSSLVVFDISEADNKTDADLEKKWP